MVAEEVRVSVGEVIPPVRTPRSAGFLLHHELVTDFRVWVREGCEKGGFEYQFVPSYEEVRVGGRRRRRVAVALPGRRLLVPDGALMLKRGERGVLFLVEVDRGTEPLTGRHPSAVERKLAAYAAAFDARVEELYAELFGVELRGFRVLCVVPDVARQRAFVALAEGLDLAPLVWVAEASVFAAPGDLDMACWAVRPGEGSHRLSE